MYTQRGTEFWKNDFRRLSTCPWLSRNVPFSLPLFPLTSFTPSKISFALFFSHSASRYVRTRLMPYVRTRRNVNIIIDSKSRLKHRTPHACIKSLKILSYHELCCWMTLVTVRWLSVWLVFSSVLPAFRFPTRHCFDARKVSPPDTERHSVRHWSRVVLLHKHQEIRSKTEETRDDRERPHKRGSRVECWLKFISVLLGPRDKSSAYW